VGEHVTLQVEDGVATIRLDRPPMNAIDLAVMEGLREAASEAAERDDVGAVILFGGEKVFAAGADVKMLAGLTPAQVGPVIAAMQDAYDLVEAIPKVVIAAINGYALGGGCELALCADIIVAGAGAQFGQPEINLGMIPGAGGMQRLARVAGKSLAMQMCLTGKPIDAHAALVAGIAVEVHEPERAIARAVEIAATIAAKPPLAVRLAKEAVLRAFDWPLTAALAADRQAFALLAATDDRNEGIAAFLDKRPAQFTGR